MLSNRVQIGMQKKKSDSERGKNQDHCGEREGVAPHVGVEMNDNRKS